MEEQENLQQMQQQSERSGQEEASKQAGISERAEHLKQKTEDAAYRTHRVGSVTLGLMLVIFGAVFLARIFVPSLSYDAIWHLWPCTLISLGIEVLISTVHAERSRYDGWGILLIFLITIFTMGMAGIENMYHYCQYFW